MPPSKTKVFLSTAKNCLITDDAKLFAMPDTIRGIIQEIEDVGGKEIQAIEIQRDKQGGLIPLITLYITAPDVEGNCPVNRKIEKLKGEIDAWSDHIVKVGDTGRMEMIEWLTGNFNLTQLALAIDAGITRGAFRKTRLDALYGEEETDGSSDD